MTHRQLSAREKERVEQEHQECVNWAAKYHKKLSHGVEAHFRPVVTHDWRKNASNS